MYPLFILFRALFERVVRMAKPRGDAQNICAETAAKLGYELVDVELAREGAGLYLRAYIDKPGGISLSDCETFHRAVQPKLEHVEYDFLEVSSPGVDRPIKTDRDLQAALGEEVVVRLFRPALGGKEHRGVLAGFDRETVRVIAPSGEKAFPRRDVARMERYVDVSVLAQPLETGAGEGQPSASIILDAEENDSADNPADAGEAGRKYEQPES
jgi:ribosome maturation factor RimP